MTIKHAGKLQINVVRAVKNEQRMHYSSKKKQKLSGNAQKTSDELHGNALGEGVGGLFL